MGTAGECVGGFPYGRRPTGFVARPSDMLRQTRLRARMRMRVRLRVRMGAGLETSSRVGMRRRDAVRLLWGHDLPMSWDD